LADRGTGRPRTRQDLAGRVLGRVLGDLDLADRRMDRGLGGRGLADRRMDRGLGGRGLAGRELAGRELARRGLAGRELAGRELARRGLAGRELAGRELAGRELAGRGLADHRAISRGALTIAVMRRWAVPGMRLAASAHATTARRLRRQREGSAGIMGLPPVGRRLTGTAPRLRVAGTVLRLPVVGTTRGTGRTAGYSRHKATSGRSMTAATPLFRFSTRFSVDGASGTSVTGFRCTDAT
jgi:hypothetical protein